MTQQGQQVLVSSRSLLTLARKDNVSQCVLLAFHEVPADAPVSSCTFSVTGSEMTGNTHKPRGLPTTAGCASP